MLRAAGPCRAVRVVSPVMQGICDDLQAETDALGEVVSGITEEQWRLPTPAQGWDSRETMVHLGMTDWVATARGTSTILRALQSLRKRR